MCTRHAHEVYLSIYIGSWDSLECTLCSQLLSSVGGIVTCMSYSELPVCNEGPRNVPNLRVPIEDVSTEKLADYVPEVTAFVDATLSRGQAVFIHCRHGVSRSAAFVLAYLLLRTDSSLKSALHLIRKYRTSACPNIGFMRELLSIEYSLRHESSMNIEEYVKWYNSVDTELEQDTDSVYMGDL
eukprot:GHVO01049524.1.p1 GENE.GHVO01049524.1~~GHVO01049524.1.p1  ORF type:complete len:184 (-),score=8.26 GHVO01049524.1:486-1037(-)